MPIKRQGLFDMFNEIDVIQMKHYIKIYCHTYVEKFCPKYLYSWLQKRHISDNCPTPLLVNSKDWLKGFNSTTGSSVSKVIAKLESTMNIRYQGWVVELIWAMTTCRPNLAFASIKLSQSNTSPTEIYFQGLKHTICYLYMTHHDGIYFWQTAPHPNLINGPLPVIHSNQSNLLLDNCPQHDASTAVVYGDSDWATCVKT
jgi:hypothetical protein